MQFRNWKSRIIDRGTNNDEFCGSRVISISGLFVFSSTSGPNFREGDDKFFELSKVVKVCPSRAGSRSKTFPEVPTIFRVSYDNPESRQSMVLGLR